jgi:hypothetical protein
LKTQEIIETLITQELEIFEEESVIFHHVDYNRSSKKMFNEKVNTKNKKKSKKWKSTLISMGLHHKKLYNFTEHPEKP